MTLYPKQSRSSIILPILTKPRFTQLRLDRVYLMKVAGTVESRVTMGYEPDWNISIHMK